MKINKKVELGIKAIVFLKSGNVTRNTRDIAEALGTSDSFLEQIMRHLRIAGLVSVKRGPGGGYFVDNTVAVSAYSVAVAVGKDFGTVSSFENSAEASDQLKKALVNAYVNTSI